MFKLWPGRTEGVEGGRQTETEIRRDRQADRNSRCAVKTFSDSDSKYFKVTQRLNQAAHTQLSSILCALRFIFMLPLDQ